MKTESSSRALRWVALIVLVLVPTTFVVLVLFGPPLGPSETLGPIRGVRLGLAPVQARRQLQADVEGSFRTVAMGEDFALEWEPRSEPGELRRARLEFHLGQLVAARLWLAPDAPEAQGPALRTSEMSVLARRSTAGGVELTWLSRACPTHAAEVRRLTEP